jgi:hypothetical protein
VDFSVVPMSKGGARKTGALLPRKPARSVEPTSQQSPRLVSVSNRARTATKGPVSGLGRSYDLFSRECVLATIAEETNDFSVPAWLGRASSGLFL